MKRRLEVRVFRILNELVVDYVTSQDNIFQAFKLLFMSVTRMLFKSLVEKKPSI